MNRIQRFMAIAGSVMDGWENIFTGLGVFGKDKRTGASIKRVKMTEKESEDLHDNDDIADKVVNMIPDEGTREWIEIKIVDDSELSKKVTDFEKSLDLQSKIKKAWAYARLYGGAGIFLSIDDGLKLDEPLNKNRIVRLNSLTVLSRYELQAQDINRDIEDPNFGLPDFYMISPKTGESTDRIHHSRIIRIEGANVSQNVFITNNYWGDSVLLRLFNVLRNFNLAHDSTASIIQDFNTGILKLKNLSELIGADEDGQVVARLKLMNLSKSIIGSILLDADEEDYTNQAVSLANLDKVLDKINERLVAATNMPHTKILGNGPKSSLAGGGDSEEKDWLAHVGNMQQTTIKKPVNQILEIMLLSKQGPTNGKMPAEWGWLFNPLWNPSQKDVVETRNKQSMTDKNYWEMGVFSAVIIGESRFGGDEYSIETHIDPKDIEEQQRTAKISPEEAEKEMQDFLEELEENSEDRHWHIDSIGGGNVGPAIEWGTDEQGRKIHVHKRPNGNLTNFSLTGVAHTHETVHGETGPVVNPEES